MLASGYYNVVMATQLIVTADDFGLSRGVNAAVVQARGAGTLTTASLMTAGDAAREAVSIARDDPGLAVGLHVTLSIGAPLLPALRYYFSPRARRQLRRDIAEQFEAFAETGLALSHVDGHQHLHAHPTVLPIVIEHAIRCGARGIRIPREPFLAGMRADRSRPGYKIVTALGQAYLARVCVRQLAGVGLSRCDVVLGGLMSGRMSADYVARVLGAGVFGSAEVYFHPLDPQVDGSSSDLYGPNAGDLEALLSPRFRGLVLGEDYCLTNYAGLAVPGQEPTHEPA